MDDSKNKPSKLPEPSEGAATVASGNQKNVIHIDVYAKTGSDQEKKTYRMHKRRAMIGSAHSCDIRIQQNSVSNIHAVIELDDQGNASIYDMASETGLFVNDKKVVSQQLNADDEIKIGFANLKFRLSNFEEEQKSLPKQLPESMHQSGKQHLYFQEDEDFRPLILEDESQVIDIFEYPDSFTPALQVAVYWGDAILNIEHFRGEEVVWIGHQQGVDFVVPNIADHFQLASPENGEYVLHLTDAMEGVVRSQSGIEQISDLKQRLQSGSNGYTKIINQDDIIKLEINDISIFISYTPAPPKLLTKKLLDRDVLFKKIWFVSLLFTALAIWAMQSVEKAEPLSVDELPPRVANIIFKPPQPMPKLSKILKKPVSKKLPSDVKKIKKPKKVAKTKPRKTKPRKTKPRVKPSDRVAKKLPKKVVRRSNRSGPKARGNRGEGVRAKGKEGSRGTKTGVKSPRKQTKAFSRAGRSGRGSGAAKATGPVKQSRGFIDTISSDIGGAIAKSLSGGAKGMHNLSGRIRAYGGYSTRGAGGLGETGSGKGGGGKSEDIAGLGTKGLGGGKSGKGLGAYGSGGGLVGGRGRPVINVGSYVETVIRGGLDKSVIDEVVKRHLSQIRHCYEREQSAGNAKLSGRIMTRFEIASSGRVSKAAITASSLSNRKVERCLAGVIKRMVFPEPEGGTVVEVSYPFQFSPAR